MKKKITGMLSWREWGARLTLKIEGRLVSHDLGRVTLEYARERARALRVPFLVDGRIYQMP